MDGQQTPFSENTFLSRWMDGQQTPLNTFQAAANLGLRAGQKLREMARREEEEEVKTKVSPIVSLIPHLFHFLRAKNVGTLVWKQSSCFGK